MSHPVLEWFAFCIAHPHVAHSQNPEAFWSVFQRACPDVKREELEAFLKETAPEDFSRN